MTTLAYPSADFPGQPAVTLDVPQCGPSYRIEESLEQVAVLAASRGGSVSEPYAADLAGAHFVGCDATWPDADVEVVLQANLFHHVPSGATGGHVVQLTGAVGGPDAE